MHQLKVWHYGLVLAERVSLVTVVGQIEREQTQITVIS